MQVEYRMMMKLDKVVIVISGGRRALRADTVYPLHRMAPIEPRLGYLTEGRLGPQLMITSTTRFH